MNSTAQELVGRPDGVTRRAQEECGKWLAECLRLGLGKAHLDTLERFWWEHHDSRGELITPNAPAEARRSRSLKPDVGTLNQEGA
jgi:hypothetical protein